jgi:predicted Zn-dependent peptidase
VSGAGPRWLHDIGRRLAAVAPAEVASAAARYLRPESLATVRMSPG